MKAGVLLNLLLFTNVCFSQGSGQISNLYKNVYPIESINPSDTNYQDFVFLDSLFQDVDVVFLGEQAHGEGNVTLAKTRLIEYLVNVLGFNIIAFESGFYDTFIAGIMIKNSQGPGDIYFNSSLYAIWTNTVEFDRMKEILTGKIRSSKVKLYGIDCQPMALAHNTYLKYLEKGLIETGFSLDSSSEDLLKKYLWGTGESKEKYFANTSDSVEVFQLLDELLSESIKFTSNENGFWPQTIINFQTNLNIQIGTLQSWPIYAIDNLRDAQMAHNLLWIIKNKKPGDKVIVWSASMHNARNIGSIQETDDSTFYQNYIPMGQIVYDSIGPRMYSLAFSSSGGQFQTPFMMQEPVEITSKKENSIESFLSGMQIQYGIVNFRTTPMDKIFWSEMYSNPHGHKNVKAVWPLVHDGIFYIDKIEPPHIKQQ